MGMRIAFSIPQTMPSGHEPIDARRLLIATMNEDGVQAMHWLDLPSAADRLDRSKADYLADIDVLIAMPADIEFANSMAALGVHVVQDAMVDPAQLLSRYLSGEKPDLNVLQSRHDCCCEQQSKQKED